MPCSIKEDDLDLLHFIALTNGGLASEVFNLVNTIQKHAIIFSQALRLHC